MSNTRNQWHLLGAGSLGCLFAAYLRRAGVAIEIIVRDAATLQQLEANGGITLARGAENFHTDIAAVTPQSIAAPITHLLICTKAQQTRAAIAAIKTHLAADATIVLLQNGMGVRDALIRELPDAKILHALSTEGAYRSARFHVVHAGHGETVIGAINAPEQKYAESIVRSLHCELSITYVPDILQRLWLKLAVNSVINPLTALHRCRNGDLLKIENSDVIIAQLCDELTDIARADTIDIDAESMRAEIYRVIHATAANKSSMLQDIEANCATEIDFINGFIVRRAQSHHLICPQHQRLLTAIHALAAST